MIYGDTMLTIGVILLIAGIFALVAADAFGLLDYAHEERERHSLDRRKYQNRVNNQIAMMSSTEYNPDDPLGDINNEEWRLHTLVYEYRALCEVHDC